MLASEDHGEVLKRASYAAYTDAVETAHRALSDSVARYVDEHREFDVTPVFHPIETRVRG
jgi:hypothetical protein